MCNPLIPSAPRLFIPTSWQAGRGWLCSSWSAGCPFLLPPPYFHRLAVKQLNVRNSEPGSGLGSLALIQLDETEVQGWIWERLISLSCSPLQCSSGGSQAGAVRLLCPARWRREGDASLWEVSGRALLPHPFLFPQKGARSCPGSCSLVGLRE